MTKKLIEQFAAAGSDGKNYTVQIWQDFKDAGTMSNPGAKIAGLKTCRTADGQLCNRTDDKTYTIVQSGVVLTRF